MIRYFGGHLPVTVIPSLPAPNPDLTIFMRGTLKKGVLVLATFPTAPAPPIPFDSGARSVLLGRRSSPRRLSPWRRRPWS